MLERSGKKSHAFVGRFSNTAAFQVFGNEIVDLINGFVKETFGEKALTAMGDSLFIAVGTGIGAIFGGPIGAVVGLIISALIDDITKWDSGTFWENFSNELFNFNYTKSLQESCTKYFKKAFSADNFIEFGENIIKGIVNGLLSGMAYLGEPIVDLVTWIGDSIKNALPFHLPEKETKEYGQEIVKNIGEGGKAGAPSAANAITDAVTSGLQNGENTSKFVNSGIYGANKVLEGGKSLNTEMQSLGSGWAAYSNEGLKQKFEELQRSSTPQVLQSWAQTGIINPFTNIMGNHSSGFVYFFLLAIGEAQYVCPIYVNTANGGMCRYNIDSTVYLTIESRVTYVNARLYGGSGALLRAYKIK